MKFNIDGDFDRVGFTINLLLFLDVLRDYLGVETSMYAKLFGAIHAAEIAVEKDDIAYDLKVIIC